MKKRLFTILTIVLGTMFMVSCGDDPAPTPEPFDPTIKATNQKILTLIQNNYLWSLPANPNLEQQTPAFFGSLLDKNNDRYTEVDASGNTVPLTYSRISPVTAPVTVYDAGFEYAINKYLGNVTYYVVLYVKPGTGASNYLKRGLYITKVNGTAVTSANANTLLPMAYAEGREMTLSIRTPMITTEASVTFAPKANYVEAPLLTSSIFMAGTKKVGYICYNNFSAGSNGVNDNTLASKLNEFNTQNVTNLVFDVRYNSGGALSGVQTLGSALVKSRDVTKVFIQQVHRPDLPRPVDPLNFIDKTAGNTAIPKLGDKLEKIYIITGQSTAGAAEALINALKAYRSADIVLVGEKTKGRNVATANATENGNQAGSWNMRLAYSYMADVNKSYNYTAGFTPSVSIQEVKVAAEQGALLGDLGIVEDNTSENEYKEVVLTRIKNIIAGTAKSASVMETRSAVSDRPLQTSLNNRLGANETTVDLQ